MDLVPWILQVVFRRFYRLRSGVKCQQKIQWRGTNRNAAVPNRVGWREVGGGGVALWGSKTMSLDRAGFRATSVVVSSAKGIQHEVKQAVSLGPDGGSYPNEHETWTHHLVRL